MDKHESHAGHKGGHEDVEKRKAELLREGEFYRTGVAHAKAQVRHGARPDVLFHSAVDSATYALRSRADALLKPTGVSVAALAPYALSIVSFLRRRRLVKPALGVTLALGAVGWYVQRKRAQSQAQQVTY